jgi:hypothetical protein
VSAIYMSPNVPGKSSNRLVLFPYTLLLFPNLAGADRWSRHQNHAERGQGHVHAPHTTTSLRCVPPTSPPQQITRQIRVSIHVQKKMNWVSIPAPK